MFKGRKLSHFILLTSAIVAVSTAALPEEPKFSVIFEVSGDDTALEKFEVNFEKQDKKSGGILKKYCDIPPKKDLMSGKTLVFVCTPVDVVFTQTGIVFIETTKPESDMTELAMTATSALSCGGKACGIERPGGTPCWSKNCSGTPTCFHYPYGCTSSHKCQ